MLSTIVLAALSLAPTAQAEGVEDGRLFVAGRTSLGVPIGASGYAKLGAIEAGVETPDGLAFSLRMMAEPNPPSVFGMTVPDVGFGPAVDLRNYYTVAPGIDIFPAIAAGFLVGQTGKGNNVVLPLIEGAVGARVRPGDGNIYIQPEIGVADIVIPYMAVSIGYRAPAKNPDAWN